MNNNINNGIHCYSEGIPIIAIIHISDHKHNYITPSTHKKGNPQSYITVYNEKHTEMALSSVIPSTKHLLFRVFLRNLEFSDQKSREFMFIKAVAIAYFLSFCSIFKNKLHFAVIYRSCTCAHLKNKTKTRASMI